MIQSDSSVVIAHHIVLFLASDMLRFSKDHICSFLGSIVLVSGAIAMPSIDTGVGPLAAGPEETIKDFAILTNDLVDQIFNSHSILIG